MWMSNVTLRTGSLLFKSPNECRVKVLSLCINAGMHVLCSAGRLFILLCLSLVSATAASPAHPVFSHPHRLSRRPHAPHRVLPPPNLDDVPVLVSSSRHGGTGAGRSERGRRAGVRPLPAATAAAAATVAGPRPLNSFTVRASRGGINKRSVDYFLSLPPNKRPLILTNLRGFSLRVLHDGRIIGSPNADTNDNIPNMLFYILSVTRTRPRLDETDSEDPEIVIRAVMTNRYVCMDTRANVFTQKMVNKSLTFDCIWRLRSFSIGVSFCQSYYPQPVQYIRDTKNRKRWFLAIDRHGNLRNGNKTKGRRDSSMWRVSASTRHLNLSNDKHVVNAMMRDGLLLSSRTNSGRPTTQRVHTGWIGAPYFQENEITQQQAACTKIESLMRGRIRDDLNRSAQILRNTNFTRERLTRLLAAFHAKYPAQRLEAFRGTFDRWVRMHWSTPYWKRRARCLRPRIKALKRLRHHKRRWHGVDKEMAAVERHLRAWRAIKKRLLRFLSPLTFLAKRPRRAGAGRVRLHALIRKSLHMHLHAFKQIKWAVYVNILYGPAALEQRLLIKYGEAVWRGRERKADAEALTCFKAPRPPRPKLAFELQRWHRHLFCIERLDSGLKKLNLNQLLRKSVETS